MAKKSESFEQSIERMDKIISSLEDRNVSLSDSIKYYEEAMKIAKVCRELLDEAEGKIKKLIDKNEMENLDVE